MSEPLGFFLPRALCSPFKASSIHTKLVLDQKWEVLYDSEVHFSIRPIPRLTAPIFNFSSKSVFFAGKKNKIQTKTEASFKRDMDRIEEWTSES